MGLGIACKRDTQSFERSLSALASKFDEYKTDVEQFRSKLLWSNIANQHIEYFSSLISQHNEKSFTKSEDSSKIRRELA
jgi:hypothetical protein